MITVLLTGAAGQIGRTFYEATRGRYRFFLVDLREPDFEVTPPDRFEIVDLSVHGASDPLTRAADVIVHLAAISDEAAEFDELLRGNILATTYLLEAAARSSCSRFVFASSIRVVQGYPHDQEVGDGLPVRPTDIYGATKCYGEALCACYASCERLSTIVIRIGDFEPYGSTLIETAYDCSAWISPKDTVDLISRSIETDGIDFFVAHGVSNNRAKRLDLTETRRVLGYTPQDDAFEEFGVLGGA